MYPPLILHTDDIDAGYAKCCYSIRPIPPVPNRYAQRTIVVLTYEYNPSIEDCLENTSFDSQAPIPFADDGQGVVALVSSLGYPEVIYLSFETSAYGPTLNETYPVRLATLSTSFYPELRVPKTSLTFEKEIHWGSVDVVAYNGNRYVFKYASAPAFGIPTAEYEASVRLREDLAILLIPRSPFIISPSHIVFSNSPQGELLFEGFLTPWCPLGTLADYIETQPCLELEEKLQCVLDVALGIEVLHRHGIFWGDLKLENVGLRAHLQPVLIDFAPSAFGTVVYAVPDVMDAPATHPTPARDVYALGVLMWGIWHHKNPLSQPLTEAKLLPWDADAPAFYMDLSRSCLQAIPNERPTLTEFIWVVKRGLMHVQSFSDSL
ncbi:kinase-like protein [Hymenopellis radicata]|nr:kinase-like protein [Hymenopellis radicata]KAF9012185.1 kinase-like protein [Hymenopellis radicata]